MRTEGKVLSQFWVKKVEKESTKAKEIKGVYQPLYEKGSINPVYKPRLSTRSIDPFQFLSINSAGTLSKSPSIFLHYKKEMAMKMPWKK